MIAILSVAVAVLALYIIYLQRKLKNRDTQCSDATKALDTQAAENASKAETISNIYEKVNTIHLYASISAGQLSGGPAADNQNTIIALCEDILKNKM